MSLLGVDDLIFGDLLAELKLKPWWEKLRGYCIAASVATTVSIIYFLEVAPNVHCMPYLNTTSSKSLSTLRSDFIDNFCRSILPWYVRHAGLVALAFCVVLICISALWLYQPSVVNALLTYAKSEEILSQYQLSIGELKSLSTAQQCSKSVGEAQVAVRRACSLLWMYEMEYNFGIAAIYRARNFFLIIVSLALVIYSCGTCSNLAKSNRLFDCDAYEVAKLSESYHQNYFCLHLTRDRILPYYIIFTATVIVQGLLAALGIWKTRQCFHPVQDGTRRWRRAVNFLNFMTTFWTNSRPVGSGLFCQLCRFLADESLDAVKTRLEQEEVKDFFLFELYTTLRVSNGEEVAGAIFSAIKAKDFEENFKEGKREKQEEMVRIISKIETLEWHNRVAELLDYLLEVKRWEILVAILNIKSEKGGDAKCDPFVKYLEDKSLNLDELGQSIHQQKSVLWYALSKGMDRKYRMTAAKRILNRCRDGRVKYVHYDGVSKRAKDFVASDSNTCDANLKELIKLILESEKFTAGESIPSASQKEISRIYKEVVKLDRWPRELDGEISRYKFTHWDEDAQNLAKLTNEKFWWRQFVELLNAFIVVDDNKSGDLLTLDCGVTDFEISSEAQGRIGNGATLLYFAFSRCENHEIHVTTAARHILACTRGQEKKLHNGGYWTEALYFVKKLSRLLDHETRILTCLIEKGNLPPTPPKQRKASFSDTEAQAVAVAARSSDTDMLISATVKETEKLLDSTEDMV